MSASFVQELQLLDQQFQLHPQHLAGSREPALVLVRGEGSRLWDATGRVYYDGVSALWNVIVGYGRSELAEAAADQIRLLPFANNYAGTTNEPAVRLAARLARLAPDPLNHVFFTAGGGEANETAMKLARFYWSIRGKTSKHTIISREGAYHGTGFGSMAATGLPSYWEHFGPLAPGFRHVPAFSVQALERCITEEGPDSIAAFIAEPVQGVAGVYPPPPDYFPRVRALCDRYDVLLIADEVITGFGRTGRYWGVQQWGVVPDLLVFAKGVTSGYLPLGGVIASDAIKQEIDSAPAGTRFMHAYTYSGHPVCCAVGLRNLEIIEREGLVECAAQGGIALKTVLESLRELPQVRAVRGLGMMWGVELTTPQLAERAYGQMRDDGLIARFRAANLILAPPLSTSTGELSEMINIFVAAVRAVAGATSICSER
ncbi:MAG: aspartate aminotransferase family protein [Chloroflexi bacterium]|nr:aspartate aminotransferase family protein [Chloroflexota bacterium]